jgi:hypothetical protein
VTATGDGRVLLVRLDWNDALGDLHGRYRLTVRVMAGTRNITEET